MQHPRPIERKPAGEATVVTRADHPPVRQALTGEHAIERQPGRLSGQLADAFFDPLPPDTLAEWEGR
jgi:hypothetical protein